MISSYRSISNSLGASNVDMREYAAEKNIQLINKYHGNIEMIINKSLGCVVDDKKNVRCWMCIWAVVYIFSGLRLLRSFILCWNSCNL